MLRIVTDSATDMPPEWVQEFGIEVIPVNIHFGERTYLQGVDLSNEDFYRLVEESGTIPKTSQPTPFQFSQFYQRIARAGQTILSIHVTSKLSGTFESAVAAARELAGKFNIIPFDSLCGSAAVGMMCREVRLMERAKASLQQILARLDEIRRTVQIALTLDTLDYARMSGRVNTIQAALASLLNVKPIITLRDGMLEMTERVRTRHRALERLIEILYQHFGQQRVNMAIVHARDNEAAKALKEKAEMLFNIANLTITELSIGIAANLGPGTVGLIAYPSRE